MPLEYEKIKRLLLDYKIPFSKTELVQTKKEALKAGKQIGYPVVLKLFSDKGEHKSDKGGVILGINNKKELVCAFNKLSKLKNDGFLVQEFVQGRELIIGMKRDPQFGPVLLFGLGGIFTEVLKDISMRIAPVNKKEALKMMKETKGFELLKGFRKQNSSNVEKIVKIIVSLSNLAMREESIKEIDFNPVITNEKLALVVDARFLIK